MIQKYFPQDKNYILKEAQEANQEELLIELIKYAKESYSINCNPLGLMDNMAKRIAESEDYSSERLVSFYLQLSGIYRYYYGSDNQLEFMFDGNAHFDKYQKEWIAKFKDWMRVFCQRPGFIKAILDLTILYPKNREAILGENKLTVFLKDQFDLKIRKKRGESAYKIA